MVMGLAMGCLDLLFQSFNSRRNACRNRLLVDVHGRLRIGMPQLSLSVLHSPGILDECCERTPQRLERDVWNPEFSSRRLKKASKVVMTVQRGAVAGRKDESSRVLIRR